MNTNTAAAPVAPRKDLFNPALFNSVSNNRNDLLITFSTAMLEAFQTDNASVNDGEKVPTTEQMEVRKVCFAQAEKLLTNINTDNNTCKLLLMAARLPTTTLVPTADDKDATATAKRIGKVANAATTLELAGIEVAVIPSKELVLVDQG